MPGLLRSLRALMFFGFLFGLLGRRFVPASFSTELFW
jgi:hypothetical protein